MDECHALWLKVAELLKQRHLKDLFTEYSRETRDKSSNKTKDDILPIPPRANRIINIISGGSEVSGVSYTATKRSSR